MFDLKSIPPESVDRALEKAVRYRLLNEPREAESICRDIVEAKPDHREALIVLLLALTDQFGQNPRIRRDHAREVLDRLGDDYDRAYYDGVIHERWGKTQLDEGHPGHLAYGWLVHAMRCYEEAEKLAPEGIVDAILRWNTCVRIINRNPALRPKADEEPMQRGFTDHVPQA